jgi:hypothetical protein
MLSRAMAEHTVEQAVCRREAGAMRDEGKREEGKSEEGKREEGFSRVF